MVLCLYNRKKDTGLPGTKTGKYGAERHGRFAMEFRNLHSFLVTAREGNVTRAAALLHISQPALSRQIMQLEKELGAALFIRGKYRVTLTEEGRLLKRRAEEIEDIVGKTEREFSKRSKVLSGVISIGCGETWNMRELSRMMAEFQELYPEVEFEIYTAVADDVKERMESGILDFGLMVEPVDLGDYGFLRMKEQERWCAMIRQDDELSKKERIQVEDLFGQKIILPKRALVKNEVENWLGDHGDAIRIMAYSTLSYFNRSMMVKSGVGIAICHEFSLYDPELVLRPLEPEISNGSVFAWKKNRELSTTADAFLQFVKNAI